MAKDKAGETAPAPERSAETSRLIAVLAGVNEYDHGWPDLSSAVNDVRSIAVAISKTHDPTAYTVHALTSAADAEQQARPTRSAILSALEAAAREATGPDCVLFYFAGHGLLIDGRSYLLPADAPSPERVEPAAMLSLEEIAARFEDSPCRQRIMLVDACNAPAAAAPADESSLPAGRGAQVRSRGVSQAEYAEAYSQVPRGWTALTACGPGQESYEEGSHGFFSGAIAQALRGQADLDGDGVVTLAELAHHVTSRVRARAWARARREQSPALYVSAGQLDLPVTPRAELTEASDLTYRWRQRSPGAGFPRLCWQKLMGPWGMASPFYPGLFTWGLAIILAAIMLTVGVLFAPPQSVAWWWWAVGAVALVSLIMWPMTVAFAVAAAERGWHWGGYLPSYASGVWLIVGFLLLLLVRRAAPGPDAELVSDAAYVGLVVLGLIFVLPIAAMNALNIMLSLDYLVRRGEPVVVEEVLHKFDREWWDMEIPNVAPMMSARPALYALVVGLGVSLVGLGHIIATVTAGATSADAALRLLADALLLMAAWWIVGWYQAAFGALRRRWWSQT